MLDIIMLTYDEPHAEKNWQALTSKFPRAKRVHGVKGIKKAHKKAAEISGTYFFYIVDADNIIKPNFLFDEIQSHLYEKNLYVYRCEVVAIGATYGYGAIKIYNKRLCSNIDDSSFTDLATEINANYHIIHEVASETHFNINPLTSWRSAFRETAKLHKQIIEKGHEKQTEERIQCWLNPSTEGRFSKYIKDGAEQGFSYAEKNSDISKINDFDGLKEQFDLTYKM